MARPRKPILDQFLALYREMAPDERPLATAALRGFDAAVAPPKPPPEAIERFEDLGEREGEEK